MSSRHRFATFSLLLFSVCFLFLPLWFACEGPSARLPAAKTSSELQQGTQPGQAAAPQSPTNDVGPLFPVVAHGKWGYIDKSGKIVIPLQYYFAYPFSEGLA